MKPRGVIRMADQHDQHRKGRAESVRPPRSDAAPPVPVRTPPLSHDARLLRDFARRCFRWIRHHGIGSSLERGVDVFFSERATHWRDYRRWLESEDRRTPKRASPPNPSPLISVLCPLRDSEPYLLWTLYTSLASQTEGAWELCLADDGSKSTTLRETLVQLQARDARVRLVRSPSSQGISAATNSAAQLAQGDVFLFVDHDDELAPGVVGRFAAAFRDEPELDLAYADEDQVTEWGLQLAPTFKPGPSAFLELGFNYVGHPLAISRSLYEAIGGLRSEFDGSQDHDLVLRAFEQSRVVRHLPGVGYHWRRSRTSVAASSVTKDWAFDRGRAAVEDACRRRGIPVSAVHHASPRGVYRIDPEPPTAPIPCRVVLHGAPHHCDDWRDFLSQQTESLDVRSLESGAWPKGPADDESLLVVNADLVPNQADIRALASWLMLPGVGAVAASGRSGSRWRNLGYSLSDNGVAEPVLPGRRFRGAAPTLLTSAVREVAAAQGGLLLTRQSPAWLRERLEVAPVAPEFELALSLGAAVSETATLFLPDCHPRWRRSAASARFGGPIDLRPTGLWPRILESLPADFWRDGSDRFCPRHPLLTHLGLPAPFASPPSG